MTDKDEFLEIGILGKTKGLKGEIYFYPHNEETLNPFKGSEVRLAKADGEKLVIVSHSVKAPKKRLLRFDGHEKIEDVESYVNSKLFFPKADLPELEEGEYYLDDLIGFSIYDASSNLIGSLKSFYFNNAHDVAVLESPQKTDLEVPFVDELILEINLDEQKILIDFDFSSLV